MPAYAYDAVDAQGRSSRGTVEADSPRGARSQLRSRGLVALSVQAVEGQDGERAGLLQRPLWQARAFNGLQLAIHTRQLAGLARAGLPLERALTVLAEEAENARQQAVLSALRAEVHAGASFGKALAQFPREFDATYRAVVAAGEQGGALAEVLERLAQDLEDGLALRSKLVGAALYPAIVCLIALAIVVFLLAYVVPQVAEVFTGQKRTLPALTVAMLWLSASVRSYGLPALILLGLLAAGGRLALRRPALALRADAAWLTLPLIGRLARSYNAARFGSTLALLCSAGVPMLRALQAAADTLSNRAMRADAEQALALVREGAPLASALGGLRRFPPLLVMFTRLGEQTGSLPDMLQRAAGQLSAEVQRRALRLATLLEPLLIVAMGGMVMLIVLAVLLPIMELNQLAR
jgi:general secretion pathway protein F